MWYFTSTCPPEKYVMIHHFTDTRISERILRPTARSKFSPSAVRVGFVVHTVSLGLVPPPEFIFVCQLSFHQCSIFIVIYVYDAVWSIDIEVVAK
jgi:hypothetical protein